jgi:hypothetical protein
MTGTPRRVSCRGRAPVFGLWVAATVGLGGGATGCILPLAPEFEEELRAPPFVVSSRPAVGSMVRDSEAVFEVEFQDPNSTDDLYVRWVIDFPPFTENLSRTIDYNPQKNRGPGQINRHRVAFSPSCVSHLISPAVSQHRLMLLISDRPFEEPAPAPDKVPTDAHLLRVVWMFDKECR